MFSAWWASTWSQATTSAHTQTANDLDENAWIKPSLSSKCRQQFLLECWPKTTRGNTQDWVLKDYESYFSHYQDSCIHLETDLRGYNHYQFCQIPRLLLVGTRQACEVSVESILRTTSPWQSAASTAKVINFIGRAVLLLDLSLWKSDETLTEYVKRTLASASTQCDRFRLPVSFNARRLDQIVGIKVKWSRDLMTHLEIGSDDYSMQVFHHVKVLDLYEGSVLGAIFPDTFIEETRNTISLLLPVSEMACMQWFRREQTRLGLDLSAGSCRYLRSDQRHIQHFDFWRDRLIIAHETFNESQPRGLIQFWRDDRNHVQWWTFWIAVVVFVLTLIGVVESALQVYKAYYPS